MKLGNLRLSTSMVAEIKVEGLGFKGFTVK